MLYLISFRIIYILSDKKDEYGDSNNSEDNNDDKNIDNNNKEYDNSNDNYDHIDRMTQNEI